MDNIVYEKMTLGQGAIKVMIKDSIHIAGFKTVAGSRALINSELEKQNAEIVDLILKSDCQILGKTNLHELAYGITGINKFTGTAINPKYPELIPGGSSSGSAAAVAANMVDFSIGTDTGGSIRMPAACCGVFGLKPTFGRVSRKGVLPEQTSLDCVGPFANDMDHLIQAMQIIDPSFKGEVVNAAAVKTPNLVMLDVTATDDVWQVVKAFLKQAGLEHSPHVQIETFDEAYSAGMQIINYETWQAFGHLVASGNVAEDVAGRLLKASKTTSVDVDVANLVREKFSRAIDQLLEQYDAIVLPTLPQIPPKVADAENTVAFLNMTALVRPFNLSGHPAITIPLQTADGNPVGLQIVTRHDADEQLCAIATHLVNRANAN
ncbi:amidase [Acinetobacter puyangensis]|uniref:Amidase n=1 Tax=Acinetobacter puyangensis TaxID=1096779 RepID=A0A240E6C3_9GAMM|nr:amidase [Acinetobacter puyangensis]SNX43425.1 amidase [Acinetobacter puyangensis]